MLEIARVPLNMAGIVQSAAFRGLESTQAAQWLDDDWRTTLHARMTANLALLRER